MLTLFSVKNLSVKYIVTVSAKKLYFKLYSPRSHNFMQTKFKLMVHATNLTHKNVVAPVICALELTEVPN